jgi:hypothetical protein
MNCLKRASALLLAVLMGSATLMACSSGTVIEIDIADRRVSEFQQNGQLITEIRVTAGQPYVFRVKNPFKNDHNFFIGKDADLAAQEYSRLVGIKLWSAGTKEVTYTFKSGDVLQFACTLAGHYSPMHGDFIVDG